MINLTKEVQQYCKRAVIRYLNGDMKEFNRLVDMAMMINNTYVCNSCGYITVQAKLIHSQSKNEGIELCTHCGKYSKKKQIC